MSNVKTFQDAAENPTKCGVEIPDNFEGMDLKPELLQGIDEYGFERPSEIQRRAIVYILKGYNVVIQNQPCTDHTATFSIPILQKLDTSVQSTQALILAPTRGLAQDIQKAVMALGKHMNVLCHSSIGGTNVREDMAKVKEGVHVITGTPGRVNDLIQRKALRTDKIKHLCLGEANPLLSGPFEKETNKVFTRLSPGTQVIFLSPTVPDNVLDTAAKLTNDSARMLIVRDDAKLHGIKQFYVITGGDENRLERLSVLLRAAASTQSIVFCGTRRKVDWVNEKLLSRGFTVVTMRGNSTQKQREVAMEEFRSVPSSVMVTTDGLAQIEIQGVALLINFDLPAQMDHYISRIGRGVLPGHKGVVINFVTTKDLNMIKALEGGFASECVNALANARCRILQHEDSPDVADLIRKS